jgi:hypothetical protein
MTFRTTPQLGQQFDEVGANYWDDLIGITIPSPKPGNKELGNDGAEYFYVTATADIAATATTGTQVALTYPAYTVATGSGGFYTPINTAVKSGDALWVRRGAYNAVPA